MTSPSYKLCTTGAIPTHNFIEFSRICFFGNHDPIIKWSLHHYCSSTATSGSTDNHAIVELPISVHDPIEHLLYKVPKF